MHLIWELTNDVKESMFSDQIYLNISSRDICYSICFRKITQTSFFILWKACESWHQHSETVFKENLKDDNKRLMIYGTRDWSVWYMKVLCAWCAMLAQPFIPWELCCRAGEWKCLILQLWVCRSWCYFHQMYKQLWTMSW